MSSELPPVPPASVRGDLPAFDHVPPGELPPGVTVIPTYTLYTSGQVAGATFLGGPIAGAWVLARNFKTLGKPAQARLALVLSIVATIALFALVFALDASDKKIPSGISSSPALISVLAMLGIANATQRSDVDQHRARNGRIGSNWYPVGVGVVSLVITVATIVGAAVAWEFSKQAPRVDFGDAYVYYHEGGTEDEARAVGTALQETKYFEPGYEAAAEVRVDTGRHIVGLVVQDWAFTDRATLGWLADQAHPLSEKAFHGEPVDIWLEDDTMAKKVVLRWEDRLFNIDLGDEQLVIYGRGGHEDEARKTAQVLRELDYFVPGVPVKVYVERDGVQPMVAFTVADGTWEDEQAKRRLHGFASELSRGAFGGKPVEIQLLDDKQKLRATLAWDARPDK